MDIFETLRLDHIAVRDLLNQVIDQSEDRQARPDKVNEATDDTDWPEAFHDLKLAVVAHNRAEETVLYEVLKGIRKPPQLAQLKTNEHHMVEELLEDLEEINPADNEWAEKLALLKNQLEAHIAEEETLVFSLVEKLLGGDDVQRLSEEFTQLADDIRQGAPYHPKGKSAINPAGLDLNT